MEPSSTLSSSSVIRSCRLEMSSTLSSMVFSLASSLAFIAASWYFSEAFVFRMATFRALTTPSLRGVSP